MAKKTPEKTIEEQLGEMRQKLSRLETTIQSLQTSNRYLEFLVVKLVQVGHGDPFVRSWLEAYIDRERSGLPCEPKDSR